MKIIVLDLFRIYLCCVSTIDIFDLFCIIGFVKKYGLAWNPSEGIYIPQSSA